MFFPESQHDSKEVTEHSDIQMTAVYAFVRLLSEAIACLPLYRYKAEISYQDKGCDVEREMKNTSLPKNSSK